MLDSLLSFSYWLWFGFAALLVILELVLGTSFFLLCLGIIALLVGVMVWLFPLVVWEYQLLFFAIGSIVSVSLWKIYFKAHPAKSDRPHLNRRAEQYVGRVFTLSEPIVNGRGKIRVDDSSWRVEGPDLPAGTKVLVVGVDSVILKVKQKSDDTL